MLLHSPLALLLATAVPPPLAEQAFVLDRPAEVAAVVTATCPGCDWGRRGHEAAALELRLDGQYSQHLFLTRGSEPAEYRVALGRLEAGPHRLAVSVDPARSARHVRSATALSLATLAAPAGSTEERLLAHAPILEARPNTLGRFSDVPLLLWVETDSLPDDAKRLRYSVVFSNEDGGTPPDRLMATWGRLTDIEFVYGVEFDGPGRVRAEQFQGPDHKLLPFAGVHEQERPLLHVVTDNNMVSDRGPKTIRFAPAPIPFDLGGTSREAIMDASPWAYAVSVREARREGRIRESARPGSKRLPDPRRFATLEACAATKDATIAFSLGVRKGTGEVLFFDSDGGLANFRIGRRATEFPNGCFRGAVALPAGTLAAEIVAVRFRAFTRIAGKDEAPLPRGSGTARLQRVNTIFLLGPDDQPGPRRFSWQGDVPLTADGAPVELTIPD